MQAQDLLKNFQIAIQKSEEKKAKLEATQRELLQKKLELEQKEFIFKCERNSQTNTLRYYNLSNKKNLIYLFISKS
jgi:hypothetical protein